jgi:hypothetical protein
MEVLNIRKNKLIWLDYLSPKTNIESNLLQYLDVFRMQLAESLSLDLNFEDTEVLFAYYPVGGYIGWHHNGNAPGYNLVITCNPEGDGEFVHYNHNTNTIIKYPDKKGWFVKVGYFGSFQEPEKMYWHCARTRSPRLTLSYIIPHLNLWQAMIDDIGIPDTNPETIDSIL